MKSGNEKEKLLLLHGMGGRGSIWRPVVVSLEGQYDVRAPDQLGHGTLRHESPPDTRPEDLAAYVIEEMQRNSFHPAWIVGHSMGGRTAAAVGHLRPEWTRGVVLVDIGLKGFAGGGFGEKLTRLLESLPDRFPSREAARAHLMTHTPDPSLAQYLLAVSIPSGPNGQAIEFPFHRETLLRIIARAHGSSVRPWIEELGQRGIPVLILRGEHSTVWTHQEFEEEKDRLSLYPSIQFTEVADTGHGLPFEKRSEFVRILKEFMKRPAPKTPDSGES